MSTTNAWLLGFYEKGKSKTCNMDNEYITMYVPHLPVLNPRLLSCFSMLVPCSVLPSSLSVCFCAGYRLCFDINTDMAAVPAMLMSTQPSLRIKAPKVL